MGEKFLKQKRSALAVKLILAASIAVHAISIAIQIYYSLLFGSSVGIPQIISYVLLFLVEIVPAALFFIGTVLTENENGRGNILVAVACLFVLALSLYGLIISFQNGVAVLNWSYIACQVTVAAVYLFIAVDAFRRFGFLRVSRVAAALPIVIGVVRLCSSGLSILDRLVFSPEMLVGLAISQTWGMLADLVFYVATFVFLIVNAKTAKSKTNQQI